MTEPELISISELVAITNTLASTATIDPPTYLNADRVYLFSGTLDTQVVPGAWAWCAGAFRFEYVSTFVSHTAHTAGVMKKLGEYYTNFVLGGSMVTEFTIPAEHAMVICTFQIVL